MPTLLNVRDPSAAGRSAVTERLRRISFAEKLAFLTGTVIALCLVVILGAAYEVLTRSAISAGRERLTTATRRLAGIAATNIRQSAARYAAVANDPLLRRTLAIADADSLARGSSARLEPALASARQRLRQLSFDTDSSLEVVLLDDKGRRLTAVSPVTTALARSANAPRIDAAFTEGPAALRDAIQSIGTKDSPQLSRLYVSGKHVYLWIVQPVMLRNRMVGYIAHERRLGPNAQTDSGLRALAGDGVTTYYANDDGSVWTTAGGIPAAPRPITTSEAATDDSRDRLLVSAAAIDGTPLRVVMQSELDSVLAPARSFAQQLLVIGALMLMTGMSAAFLIGRRVVRPIVQIADAVEALARGQYHVRVPVARETEIARLADSFNHMANEVAAADETRREIAHMGRVAAVAELASSIAHELRQPLTAIRANAEAAVLLLGDRSINLDETSECVRGIVSDCDRAAGVISHIHMLLRKEQPLTARVDLNAVCREAVHLLRQDAALRRTVLELSLAPHPLTVVGDPVQLQQVVLNLTMNALDAASCAQVGMVKVFTSARPGSAEAAIRDNGPGLRLEVQQRLFEPFFTTKTRGLGMGLAIVRSIVERHHGHVSAENAVGGGAVFKVQLPLVRAEPAESSHRMPTLVDRPLSSFPSTQQLSR